MRFYGKEYVGTDPVQDTILLYEDARKKEYNIKLSNGIFRKQKEQNQKDPFDVFGRLDMEFNRILDC